MMGIAMMMRMGIQAQSSQPSRVGMANSFNPILNTLPLCGQSHGLRRALLLASQYHLATPLRHAGLPPALAPGAIRCAVRCAPFAPSWLCSAAAVAAPLEERGAVDTSLVRYRCHSKDGAVVEATADARDGRAIVVQITVAYDNVPHLLPNELQLHWGMYRASGVKWHHPREAVPSGSTLAKDGSGAMRTAMTWDERARVWTARFQLVPELAPLNLAFALYQPDTDRYDNPLRAPHFCVPVGMSAGSPEPLGAAVVASSSAAATDPRDVACAVNFAVFSRHASAMQLCLVRVKLPAQQPAGGNDGDRGGGEALEAQSVLEISLDPLTNRTGDVWHICVHGLKDLESLCWAWRADGEVLWQNGHRFHPGFMLMDPWTTRAVPVVLPADAHKAAPRMAPSARIAGQPVWLGSLAAFAHAPFDWQGMHQAVQGGQSRVGPLEEGVVVEVDVTSFTNGPGAEAVVPPGRRGKYLGILDRLEQLRALGASTVLLSHVVAGGGDGGGRHPLALFAPDPALAVGGPLAAAAELKTAIRELHRAGLEVMLQVEFCVTSEGGDTDNGRLQGMRGLDNAVYYREGLATPVLNCGHPVVRSLVVSALRHWAAEYRVEGFCFTNAENLTQDKFGSVLDNPPLAEEIAADPLLRNLKLIAAVSNNALLPRQAERGFPHWGVWMQVNDRFASDLNGYLTLGQRGLLSRVATRLTGSADLFAARWDAGLPGGLAAARRPAFGINALAPLADRPLSAAVAEVLGAGGADARCEAIARSLLVAQFVSAGQPLVAAATAAARPAMAQLLASLAAVRRGYRGLLCPPSLTSADRVLTWHSPYGGGGEPDWAAANPDPVANVLVLTIGGGAARPGHMLAIAFNPNGEPATIALPAPPAGTCWRLLVDTARPVPVVTTAGAASLGAVLSMSEQGSCTMGPHAAVLLDAVPLGVPTAGAPAAAATVRPAASAPPPPPPSTTATTAAKRPGDAAPPPGYGLSPAAAAAAAGSAKPKSVPYKVKGASGSTRREDGVSS